MVIFVLESFRSLLRKMRYQLMTNLFISFSTSIISSSVCLGTQFGCEARPKRSGIKFDDPLSASLDRSRKRSLDPCIIFNYFFYFFTKNSDESPCFFFSIKYFHRKIFSFP